MSNFSNYTTHQDYFLRTKGLLKHKSLILNLIKAMRPHLLVFSVFPLLSVIAYVGFFNGIAVSFVEVALLVLATLLAHISVFFYGDYYQYKTGESFVIGKENNNIIALGLVKPKLIRNLSAVLLFTAFCIGGVLVLNKPATISLFLFMGLFFAIAYVYSIKKNIFYLLGEFAIFLCFGPLLVNGGYFYFSNGFDINVFILGIIFGTVSFLVYQNNSIENIIYDDKAKKHSLVKTLGFDNGKKFIIGLEILIMCLLVAFMALVNGVQFAVVASPVVYFLYSPFIRGIKNLASPLSSKVLDLKMDMVKLQVITTVLVIGSVVIADVW